jgi:hypothetical protein
MFTRDAKRMHLPIGIDDVRFGSFADISQRKRHVRFIPKSRH